MRINDETNDTDFFILLSFLPIIHLITERNRGMPVRVFTDICMASAGTAMDSDSSKQIENTSSLLPFSFIIPDASFPEKMNLGRTG
jgi:hypothetical protein